MMPFPTPMLGRGAGSGGVPGTSAIWWRLFITDNNGGTAINIDEMELRSAVGGADITSTLISSSPEAVASSAAAPSAGAWAAFDGANTGWVSNFLTTNQWLAYRFPTPQIIRQFAILCNLSPDRFPKNFSMQASNDSTNGSDGTWVTVGTYYYDSWTITPIFYTFITTPYFTTLPSLSSESGFYAIGDTLTVSSVYVGDSATYRWLADGVAIPGATSASYTLTSAELGATIQAEVTVYAGGTTAVSSTASLGPLSNPTFSTDRLLLSGDMQAGTDKLLLSGDMQAGTDYFLISERTA